MLRVLTAFVLIVVVLLLLFKAPLGVITLAAAIVALLAIHEYSHLANAIGAKIPIWLLLTATAVFFYITFSFPGLQLPVLSLLALILLAYTTFGSPLEQVLPNTAYSFFGLIYVAYPLTLIPLLSTQENGTALLLFLLVVVWAGDIVALYVGRSLGKHKLAPHLSPNKTWEGSYGSMAGSLLAGLAVVLITNELNARNLTELSFADPVWQWLVIAAMLNVAAQIGDLVESAIKRGAGVKDSGKLLPGHGGILDRIDALLLAAPVLWYAQLIQGYFVLRRF
ncbi:MAG: phosphatidate cytidylyltransferase [Acidobacteriaceae bacterium]